MFTNASLRLCGQSGRKFAFAPLLRRLISKSASSAGSSEAMTAPTAPEDAFKAERVLKSRRALSTIQPNAVPSAACASASSKEESREFMAVFPDVVRELTDLNQYPDLLLADVGRWLAKVLQYNVPNGKKNRGMALVQSYKMMENPELLTPEAIRKAIMIGWCVELVEAFFLINDDVMDGSEMRRGAPCWYRQENVGLLALNDANMIENCAYVLLKKVMGNHPCYNQMVDRFRECILLTIMGQHLDSHVQKNGRPVFDYFNMERYTAVCKYKTGYYSYYLPVSVAMYMAGKTDPELHRQVKTILLEIGIFFQVQDDFLDVFGEAETTGKIGTDIKEGKCSWLAVVALQRCTTEQRALFEEHYGRSDPASVDLIKNLYFELGLPSTYAIYEEQSYNLIRTHIQQMSAGVPHELFFKLMNKIYRRKS